MSNEPSPDTPTRPSALYVWLVPSEEVLEQPGSWRIRKWDTEPFPEANYTVSERARWIAVSERLPEDDRPVAVLSKELKSNAAIANYSAPFWMVQADGAGEITVTHWCDCIPPSLYPEDQEVGICSKCGTNRFKAPCPYTHSSPLNCPMVGDAKGPQ